MKTKITHQYERPDGTIGTCGDAEDLLTLQARVFGHIRKLMSDDGANATIMPASNAYNWGQYEEALKHFEDAMSICPQVKNVIHPHVEICKRVTGERKDAQDLAYEESISKWESRSRLSKYFARRNAPSLQVRCKYCGHYTPYIDPMHGFAYLGNNCVRCRRGYPVPDVSWDSIDGQAYIYYRRSVFEKEFYREFEDKYDVVP